MTRFYTSMLLVLCIGLLAGSLPAQDSSRVHSLARLDTFTRGTFDVTLQGDTAYVASFARGFLMLDMHSLDSIRVIADYLPEGEDEGSEPHVAAFGHYVYLKDQYGVLRTMDVSNPILPTETNVQSWNGEIGNLVVADNMLYVATEMSGVQIFNLADPSVPAHIATVDSEMWVEHIAISGNRAYCIEGDGLAVIDITNPAEPQVLGRIENAMDRWYRVVAVSGTHVFTLKYTSDDNETQLIVIDVSDPANPAIIGSAPYGAEPYGLAVEGTLAYVTGSDDYLRVFDVSTPEHPMQMGYYRPVGGYTYGLATANGNVFMATRPALYVLRYESPNDVPREGTVAHMFTLSAPYPNPFNGATRIGFTLPQKQKVELSLYDMLGRKVRDIAGDVYPAGRNEVTLQSQGLSTGVYFVRFMPLGGVQKVMILK